MLIAKLSSLVVRVRANGTLLASNRLVWLVNFLFPEVLTEFSVYHCLWPLFGVSKWRTHIKSLNPVMFPTKQYR